MRPPPACLFFNFVLFLFLFLILFQIIFILKFFLIFAQENVVRKNCAVLCAQEFSPSFFSCRFIYTFTEQPSDSTLPQHMALTI